MRKKLCRKCGRELAANQFYQLGKYKHRPGYRLSAYCRECRRTISYWDSVAKRRANAAD